MSGHLETRRLRFTLRSPLHIGSRIRQYTPLEVVAAGGWIYKVAEMRLARALQSRGLLDTFVIQVTRAEAEFRLDSFLAAQRLTTAEFLGSVAEFRTRAPAGVRPELLATFRPAIRGALEGAYVPGSSIKGAMRTALLGQKLAGDSALVERVAKGVSDQIDRRAKREWLSQRVLGDLLQGQLPLGRRRPDQVTPQHREWLRTLKVSDARYTGETAVCPVRVLSLRRGDDSFYMKEQMLLECIPAGATLTCSITLDRGLMAEFQGTEPFRDLDDLLGQVAAFSGRVLDDEFRFFDGLPGAEEVDDFYDQTDANLRLGFGSGLPATTVHLNLPEPVRLRLRDEVFRTRRESRFFPKSRRVVVEGERPVMPLGWVKVEVIGP